MTIAEMLIRQGREEGLRQAREEAREKARREGRREGQLETLEQAVRLGVDWRHIEAAADPATLRALKERLAANGQPDGDDQSESPESPR